MLHKLIGHILEAADVTQEEWEDIELSLVMIIAKKKQLEASLKDREEDLKFEYEKRIQLEDVLDAIVNDHQTQAEFAAKEDWHGLFNWVQGIAKKALGGE